jgi:hypothetical protein
MRSGFATRENGCPGYSIRVHCGKGSPVASAMRVRSGAGCCAHLSAPGHLVAFCSWLPPHPWSRFGAAPAVNFSFERNRRGCLKVMCGGPPGDRTPFRAGFLGLLISQATCCAFQEQPVQTQKPSGAYRRAAHYTSPSVFNEPVGGCSMACHPVAAFCCDA